MATASGAANWVVSGQGSAPVLDAVLNGFAAGLAATYDQITFSGVQTRLATATGSFLDMAATDFTRGRVVRKPGQTDATLNAKLRAEIVRPRVTRASITRVLLDLTGRAPDIFEPARATDTGGYNVGGIGYGAGGGYGSRALPFQLFVHAYRATGGGIANSGGYYTGSGWAGGGYGQGGLQYASLSMSQGQITDADIYAAIASVMATGTTAWTAIT